MVSCFPPPHRGLEDPIPLRLQAHPSQRPRDGLRMVGPVLHEDVEEMVASKRPLHPLTASPCAQIPEGSRRHCQNQKGSNNLARKERYALFYLRARKVATEVPFEASAR